MTGATLVTSSGYLTRTSRNRGRHRKQPPARLLFRRRLALGGSAVLLAALIVSVGAVVKWATHDTVSPQPTALPSTTVAASPPQPPDEPPSPATPVVASPAPFAVDDKGFVNSGARCDGNQTAVAIGRTQGSLVVICGDSDGRYSYRGVRLRDDAVLKTAARTTATREFVAQNASVTYSISPAELRITAAGRVLRQEPMIDYREPDLKSAR